MMLFQEIVFTTQTFNGRMLAEQPLAKMVLLYPPPYAPRSTL